MCFMKSAFLLHFREKRPYTYFAHPIVFFFFFCLTNREKNTNIIYQVWFLFGVIPGVDSYSSHFGTINK